MSHSVIRPVAAFSGASIITHSSRYFLGLLLGTLIHNAALADIVLSAPPRESAEADAKLYEPLAESLTELLGEKMVYQYPGSWHNYQKQLQNDKYDIVFDGPHFAAWRMTSLQARPLVRLPGSLRFVLVVPTKDIVKVNDLVGKPVCTLPSPNLGALTHLFNVPQPGNSA